MIYENWFKYAKFVVEQQSSLLSEVKRLKRNGICILENLAVVVVVVVVVLLWKPYIPRPHNRESK